MNRLGRKAPRVIPAIPAPKGLKVIPVILARRENPAPLVLTVKTAHKAQPEPMELMAKV